MMEVIETLVPGCMITLLNNKHTRTIKIVGFVDDKRHDTNIIMQIIKESSTHAIEKSIIM